MEWNLRFVYGGDAARLPPGQSTTTRMEMTMKICTRFARLLSALSLLPLGASAQISDNEVKIGVMVDKTGI
jgi:hypothetical protein